MTRPNFSRLTLYKFSGNQFSSYSEVLDRHRSGIGLHSVVVMTLWEAGHVTSVRESGE